MNRNSNEIRQVFLRLYKANKSISEIAQILGLTRQTIYNWKKLEESKLLTIPSLNTRKPPAKLQELNEYIKQNPFAFNKEIAKELNTSKSSIQRWRQRLNISRKKAKTTYKESDIELKKTSNKN